MPLSHTRAPVPERDLQRTIVELAHLTGWRVHHVRTAANQRGRWETPIQGDPGFPDLVLAKPGRLVIAELKSDTGKLSPDQEAWLATLSSVVRVSPGFEVHIWRPCDWSLIERTLKGSA